ncbi:predicted protein [Botrytis cinerea T4]|uniref:Uncharacterized protein n=1 Tax=Botryotinia fuckeliana (strain T4) TaxID=999810 RepID=G2YCT1_BOTF4|nr:predicted protein [Botrytis cinerea T4]
MASPVLHATPRKHDNVRHRPKDSRAMNPTRDRHVVRVCVAGARDLSESLRGHEVKR